MTFQLWNRIRDWLLFYLFLVLSIVAMVSKNDPMLRGMRSMALNVTSKVETRLAWAGSFLRTLDENKKLLQENIEFSSQLAYLRQSDLQIQQLNTALGFQTDSTYATIATRVLTKDLFGENGFITLDAGRSNGVDIDMAVVSPRGIIGRVIFVSEHYSRVLSFQSTAFHVPAEIQTQHSQIVGIISWPGDNRRLLALDNVVRTADVEEGQTVLTNRASGIFPPGYPVGTIASVENQAGENLLKIRVLPAEDLSRVQHAFVILRLPDAERDSLERLQLHD